jgi:hypothetical protein
MEQHAARLDQLVETYERRLKLLEILAEVTGAPYDA